MTLAFRICASIAFALGIWSAAYAFSLLLHVPVIAAAVVLAGIGIAFARVSSPKPVAGGRQPVAGLLWLLFASSCALFTAAVVEHTLRFPDGGYDAWMIWNVRARFLVRADDWHKAFSPNLLFWLHTDYPWLVPGVVALSFKLLRSQSLAIPAVISWAFGALALAILTLGLARLRGVKWGLLGGLALATMPCFATFSSNQQSDVPLGLFLLLACVLIEEDQLLLAGFAAGLGAWTKNEGLLYLACMAVALRRPRAIGAFLLGSAPFLALLVLFKLQLPVRNDLLAFSTAGAILGRALDLHRWGELALLVLRRIVFFQDFALWVVAELLLLALVRPRTRLGTALFLACAAYAPIYVLQPHPLDWIFRTSVDRIFIQLWPAAVLATVLATVPGPATART